jgi:hypothetical protein
MIERCHIFIDLPPESGSPAPGDYLVTIGKRGPGSVYQIAAVRQARRRDPDKPARFHLEALRAPDMLERVSVTPGGNVVIPGETVWWMRWYARGRKATRKRDYVSKSGNL